MKKPPIEYVKYGVILILFCCILFQSWHGILAFLGILFTAIIPLILGGAIAYIVAIPTNFFQRHFFPKSKSPVVAALRQPICLAAAIIIAFIVISVGASVLIPALVDTVTMVQKHGEEFIEETIKLPVMSPVRGAVHDFMKSELMQDLKNMDIAGVVNKVFGGSMGDLSNQVMGVFSTLSTGFFGIMFSFILLSDNSNIKDRLGKVIAEYLGPERAERFAVVAGIADSTFHNFIVRQGLEATILGTVGTLTLVALGYPYALGVGVLLGLAALVPIVGYPVGLVSGTFLVVMMDGFGALIYVAVVAIAQVIEATFILPHIGDPDTALPPVWVTVGVTIGGGVAGFVGMLVAIPITSTIRQLVILNVKRRQRNLPPELAAFPPDEPKDSAVSK